MDCSAARLSLGTVLCLLSACSQKGSIASGIVCEPACPPGTTCTIDGCTPTNPPADMSSAVAGDLSGCNPPCAGATPYCSPGGACVPCLVDDHCPAGFQCKMSGSSMVCVQGCRDDATCLKSGPTMHCCGGSCTDTATDPDNCGGCGSVCGPLHASATCVDGACTPGGCSAGWGDCNRDPADGCETNVHTDATNCGGCGQVCSIRNALAGCSGACYIRSCTFGFDDCDGQTDNGCEKNVLNDAKNCGACGASCPAVAHARNQCINGSCQLATCDVGFGDCDRNPANGCEVAIFTDSNNCGACGTACGQGLVCRNGGCTCPQCNFANASSKCVNNVCVLDQCVAGFADCNGDPKDGCEIDTTSDDKNCGGCGNLCPMNMMVCVTSACSDVPVIPFFASMQNPVSNTSRTAGSPCGTLLTANQAHSLRAIAVHVNLSIPTNIKFMIFTHPGHVLAFITAPKMFQAGSGWMKSDPFPPFALEQGLSYDVGGTADQSAVYNYDQIMDNQNGIISLVQNPNWTNYANPLFGGHAAVDCGVQLF